MAKSYEERKNQINEIRLKMSATARDIGEIPEVENKNRRNACKKDFKKFCITYFPEVFNIPFSPDHLKAISKIEKSILQGGCFALAMPRGSGKTTIVERSAIWALIYGHRKFVALIGATTIAAIIPTLRFTEV